MGEFAYIDPNPKGLDLINHEDLSIFVELSTIKKERSAINVNDENKSYSINPGGKKTPIRFLKGSDIDGDGRNELTTHYTEINTNFNQSNSDLETLGITSIDIDFNSSYTPLINIKFTDVRGKLFEMGNESPYNVFFNLPYPIFELTIKGYYGKAVKYCLHLTKFSGKLNDKTGSFEISCDFIGYTYAFLSDMLMGILRGVSETDIAKEKILKAKQKNPNFLSFNELNDKIKKLNKEIDKLKHDDKEVAQLSVAEDTIISIGELKNDIKKLFKQIVSTRDLNDEKTVEILNLGEVIFFKKPTSDVSKQNLQSIIKNYNDSIHSKVNQLNKQIGVDKYKIEENKLKINRDNNYTDGIRLIDFEPFVYEDLYDKNGNAYINNANNNKKIPNADSSGLNFGDRTHKALPIIKNRQTDLEKPLGKNDYYNYIREKLELIPSGVVSPTQYINLIDLRDGFNHLTKIENDINNDLDATKEAVAEKLINKIEEILEFKPTIKNIIYILTEHVHIFLQCIKEVAGEVNKSIENNQREKQLGNLVVDREWDLSDTKDCNPTNKVSNNNGGLNNILPFPDYKEYNSINKSFEDAWIGKKAPLIPEVDFIEQLLEGLIAAKKKDNDLVKELQYGEDEWYPINVFDTKIMNGAKNPWKQFKNSKNPDDIIRHMLMRAIIFLGYSHTKLSNEEIIAMAKLEANNTFNNIETPEIRRSISLYKNESSVDGLVSKVNNLASKVGNINWENASKIWNGNRMYMDIEYETGYIFEDINKLNEYTYISVPNFNNLLQYTNEYNQKNSGSILSNDLVDYESKVTDKYIPLSVGINNLRSDIDDIDKQIGVKYYLPLSTPNDNDAKFFNGNEIIVKNGEKSILGNLTTDSDRISLRESGKIFFSSFIGGNSSDGFDKKLDDGATTIKIIDTEYYKNRAQGPYPKVDDGIFKNINKNSILDLSEFDEIEDNGLSDYNGIFAGRWRTHEFTTINLGDDNALEGVGTNIPSWLLFYANHSSNKMVFTPQRKYESDGSVIKTQYDIILDNDGNVLNPNIEPIEYDTQYLNDLNININKNGIYTPLNDIIQSDIIFNTTRNNSDFGKVRQYLIQSVDEGLENVSIPFLGFEVYDSYSNDKEYIFKHHYSIFGSDLYFNQDELGKAYLFLHSIPWDGLSYIDEEFFTEALDELTSSSIFSNCGESGNSITDIDCLKGSGLFTHHIQFLFTQRSAFIETPYLWICFLGAILWRYKEYITNNNDPIVWEKNGYSLIPLNGLDTKRPNPTQYLLPNVQKNEIFAFLSTNMDDKDYVFIERVISKMPESMVNIFIDEFKKFVEGDEWESIKREYDLFYKEDGTYPTDNERIELWLKWAERINNDPNTLLNDQNIINPKAKLNYIIIGQDNSYMLYYDVGTDLHDDLKSYMINGDVNSAKNKVAQYDIGSPFNFFLEMRGYNDSTSEGNGQKVLFGLLTKTKIIANSSRRLWLANADDDVIDKIPGSFPFRWSPDQMSLYLRSYFNEYKNLINNDNFNDEENELKRRLFNSVDSDDIKIQLYKTIKSIYDKWIPGNECDIELCGSGNNSNGDCPQLIDTFRFIDRAYNDIGDEFLVNPIDMVLDMVEDYNISMYDYLAKSLVSNNFDFIPLPTFINYNNPDAVKDVFKPEPFNQSPLASGPQFICMYIGETSKHLDLGDESGYKNDSFNITDDGCLPSDFIHREGEETTYIPAFRVAYGDQNQSIFKNFKLDQTEFTETEESLKIIDELANQQVSNVGQNLYNVYRTRSYSATIETLGNAQIQPFMYFQLDNVPMFTGAYTIIHVKHTIKPNHMSTQFKGVRVRKTKTPMIKRTSLFMNLIGSLNDVDTNGVTLDNLVDSSNNLRIYRDGKIIPNNVGSPDYAGCVSYVIKENDGIKPQTNTFVETSNKCKAGTITPFTIEEVGRFMEYIGIKWHNYAKDKDISDTIYYNDISLLGGGKHPCHSSHTSGLDIDFRQIGNTKDNISFDINSNTYNREETIKLFELILDEGLNYNGFSNGAVNIIFFNDELVINHFKNYKGYNRDMVINKPGHTNHVHIRFNLPDRISNDEPNGYLVCKEALPQVGDKDNYVSSECTTKYTDLDILPPLPVDSVPYTDVVNYLNSKYPESVSKAIFAIMASESRHDDGINFKSAGGFNFGGIQTDNARWGGLDKHFIGQFCKKDSIRHRMFAAFSKYDNFLDFMAERVKLKGFDKFDNADHWAETYIQKWWSPPDKNNPEYKKGGEIYEKKKKVYISWSNRFDNLT